MTWVLVVTGGGDPIAVVGKFYSQSTAEHKAILLRQKFAAEAPEPDDPFDRGLEVRVCKVSQYPEEGK